MTAPRSSRPLPRRALKAGRVALLVVAVVVSIPVWIVWALAVALFSIARPFLTVPLGLAMVAGCGVAIYFVTQGELASAARAAFVAAIAGAVFYASTLLGDRIGPRGGPSWPMPPWWWYF